VHITEAMMTAAVNLTISPTFFFLVAKAEREAAAEASGVQGLIAESMEQRHCASPY
jgi:hypothetical protein